MQTVLLDSEQPSTPSGPRTDEFTRAAEQWQKLGNILGHNGFGWLFAAWQAAGINATVMMAQRSFRRVA
jgi:predicted dienelactone hydrolase